MSVRKHRKIGGRYHWSNCLLFDYEFLLRWMTAGYSSLTNEYQLLLLLLEHKNQTITREQILEKLWDVDGNYVNDNTLTTLVKRLRQKVEDHPQMPKMLLTVRGFGYKAVDYEG